MNDSREPIVILVADDDKEDCMLTKDALEESRLANNLHFVHDGDALMDYLHHRGTFSNAADSPRPGLILLDLNMPKKDGREALKEIKSDPDLREIPVVVLTTSKSEEDVFNSYNLGANSYIKKPVSFPGLVEAMKQVAKYWFEIVELPVRDPEM